MLNFTKTTLRTVAIGVLVLAGSFTFSCNKKVTMGKNEVIYKGSATEQDAQNLATALKTAQYFSDNDAGTSVILTKDSSGTAISFVVKDGFWDDPKYVDGFTQLSRSLAPTVGGLPLKMRMVNEKGETKKEVAIS